MTTWALYCALYCQDLAVLGHKCGVHDCTEVAPWLSHWPGAPSPKCDRHRIGLEHIARVMGFALVSTPLSVREWPVPSAFEQRVAQLEME